MTICKAKCLGSSPGSPFPLYYDYAPFPDVRERQSEKSGLTLDIVPRV